MPDYMTAPMYKRYYKWHGTLISSSNPNSHTTSTLADAMLTSMSTHLVDTDIDWSQLQDELEWLTAPRHH